MQIQSEKAALAYAADRNTFKHGRYTVGPAGDVVHRLVFDKLFHQRHK